MKYSEQQLKAWTSPLSQSEEQRAENTIRMIKAAMDANSQLRSLDYEVFVQGSYANNTNVRTDSDVDVCVMLKSTFYMELPSGKTREDYNIGPGTMEFQQYRDLVKQALRSRKQVLPRRVRYHIVGRLFPRTRLCCIS